MSVRNYFPQDLEGCRGLWVELNQWHRDIYNDQSIGGKDPGKKFDEHLSQVGSSNIWVAASNSTIIGLAGLIRSEGSAEIEPVVVKSGYRDGGVGRLLVETVVRLARKEGLLKLTVRPVARNKEAIQFFHGMGFDTLGHLQMIQDFRDKYQWKPGVRIYDEEFRV